jgi:hypothetical protein
VYSTISKIAEKPSNLNIVKNDQIEKILIDLKESILTGNYQETIANQKAFEKFEPSKRYYLQDIEYSYLMAVFYLKYIRN